MSQISDNLNKVADRIIESDQIGAKILAIKRELMND